MTQNDLGWLETKLNDSEWLRMTQDPFGNNVNDLIWLYMSQVYSCSSFLRSIGSWYLDIQWLGDISERDNHTGQWSLFLFLMSGFKLGCCFRQGLSARWFCLNFHNWLNFNVCVWQIFAFAHCYPRVPKNIQSKAVSFCAMQIGEIFDPSSLSY